ncbi:hypothetical protein BDY17DRAFT_324766 [Neohortaea acidophila]|uniref:Uncharacterized protein n=1 Tax=Neohortaea acidophila TaxID=245834 RepID=A0A6A6PQU8_9PEZI|nr:uncharacterized protein BDY17DRAFT_324766 [Neohortaea acidophila]KAF2482488.1 hypothetical protein BDY17DRAFT_324766 [Neohortaea acidophila]
MKEEPAPVEEPLAGIQEASDPTDPQPPPQAVPIQGESLPPLHPPARSAAATPPVLSAANTRPNSIPPQPSVKPDKPAAHGGPTRQYLNQNITPHLLEGMKHIAFYEPEKPLLWLADFLRDRSKEIEG